MYPNTTYVSLLDVGEFATKERIVMSIEIYNNIDKNPNVTSKNFVENAKCFPQCLSRLAPGKQYQDEFKRLITFIARYVLKMSVDCNTLF